LERAGIVRIVAPSIQLSAEVSPPLKLIGNAPSPLARGNFRLRHEELETQRTELAARLPMIGQGARQHPGNRHAIKLLNDAFCNLKLARRFTVRQAAAWLIGIPKQVAAVI